MMIEPRRKRTVAFIDGQNLYHAAKAAFSYSFPNYDPELLAKAVCDRQGWDLVQTRFTPAFLTKGTTVSGTISGR